MTRASIKMMPPDEVLAEWTLSVIKKHDEWDSLHMFMTGHWDGKNLHVGTMAAFDPSIDPSMYPQMMAAVAAERIAEEPDNLPCAYLLQFEGYSAQGPGPDATEEERRSFEADTRPFADRPDSEETVMAICVATSGRMWTAVKSRSRPGVIEEAEYSPGDSSAGGRFNSALTRIAENTACLGIGDRNR